MIEHVFKRIPFLRDMFIDHLLKYRWVLLNLTHDRFVEYPWVFKNLDGRSGKILDVGFGKFPLFPLQLCALGYNVYGIDLSDRMNKIFKEMSKILNFKIIIDDIITSNKFSKGFFDIITCISTIEHIEDGIGAINGIRKLLKDDGILFLTTPYGKKPNSEKKIEKTPWYDPVTKKGDKYNWTLYNKQRIKRLIRDFSVLKKEYFIKKNNVWIKTNEKQCASRITRRTEITNGLICLKLCKG